MTARIPLLQRAIDAMIGTMAVPGVLAGHRLIADGDESALLPDELSAFAGSVTKVRRASGAARIVARELLGRLGHAPQAIPRSASGPPVWPGEIVGSLAHDAEIAVAALANRRGFLSLGIDVEPAEPLDPELLAIVATPGERARMSGEPSHERLLSGRLLFAVKEAVYKAVFPLDRAFLDHHDVEVDFSTGTAVIRNGRIVRFRHCVAGHFVVLAFISAVVATGQGAPERAE